MLMEFPFIIYNLQTAQENIVVGCAIWDIALSQIKTIMLV